MHWKSIAAQPEINRYVADVEAASDFRSFRGNGVIEGWGRALPSTSLRQDYLHRSQIGIAEGPDHRMPTINGSPILLLLSLRWITSGHPGVMPTSRPQRNMTVAISAFSANFQNFPTKKPESFIAHSTVTSF